MQSKGMTYLLIGTFIMIWVIAGFRVYKAVHQDDDIYKQAATRNNREIDGKIDTFSLQLNYQDPFAIKVEQVVLPSQPTVFQRSASNTASQKEAVKLPQVAYRPSGLVLKGIISNNTAKCKVVLISIQGKEISIKEKEKVGILTLLKVFNEDSVRIDYDGHQINLLR